MPRLCQSMPNFDPAVEGSVEFLARQPIVQVSSSTRISLEASISGAMCSYVFGSTVVPQSPSSSGRGPRMSEAMMYSIIASLTDSIVNCANSESAQSSRLSTYFMTIVFCSALRRRRAMAHGLNGSLR